MLGYFSSIIFRYLAIALQFVVVALVAHKLSKHDAGVYFLVTGVVMTTYFMSGVGLPDGLMRGLSEAVSRQKFSAARVLLIRGALATAAISLVTALIGALVAWSAGVEVTVVVEAAFLWLAYSVGFFVAQSLVGYNQRGTGAFFFYSAANIALTVTLVPYLLLARNTSLDTVLAWSNVGIWLSSGVAIVWLLRVVMQSPNSDNGTVDHSATLRAAFSLGIIIASSRVLQTAVYWIPAWAIGVRAGPALAGTVSIAGRLAVAVAAVMAAIRFSVRPAIVAAEVRGDWPAIEKLGRRIATAATALALAAILFNILAGPPVIGAVFGSAYRAAALTLSVLLVGTLAESIGGPVDEVLRMTGSAHVPLTALLVAIAVELGLSFGLAPFGPPFAAAGQVAALLIMYGWMIAYLHKKRGILLLPAVSITEIRQLFSRKQA